MATVLNVLNGIVKTPTADVLWGAAPIDWCEENLPETNPLSIAEFHNSWTNIFYIISGLLLLRSHLRLHSDIRDPLFAFFIFNIIMTGVTSAWFHSTLLFLAQKSDEFFENAAMVSLLYYHVFPLGSSSKIIKYRGACCAVHTLLLGVGILCIPDLFCEIHLITTVLITFKTGYIRTESLPPHTRSKALNLFSSSFASVGVAFFCWLLDFLLCIYFSPFYLHAFVWHLGTSISLYYGGEASLLIREKYIKIEEKEKNSKEKSY
ncbi:hypothetical protein TrST_g11411 [Triparma strigata]|uniref:Uncharacterized protein n=1 Tax=Triparma strigata TaxID=1606541 RepID=A0A9W7AZM1_9STRA|nr:hypothetical protein TrST_g11411 [Triparma strigata]